MVLHGFTLFYVILHGSKGPGPEGLKSAPDVPQVGCTTAVRGHFPRGCPQVGCTTAAWSAIFLGCTTTVEVTPLPRLAREDAISPKGGPKGPPRGPSPQEGPFELCSCLRCPRAEPRAEMVSRVGGHARSVKNDSKGGSRRVFGNGSENGAENGAQNGWILRGLALKNRALVCTGCVFSKIEASRNESRKWTKMEPKMSSKCTKMASLGALGADFGDFGGS